MARDMNIRDWYVIIAISIIGIVASTFLFEHPSEANFVTWGTMQGVIVGAYKWIDYKDSKVPDADSS
jgi:hypothetical protein